VNWSVPDQHLRSEKGVGLSRARLELVHRYVAEAQGPPPRLPLRFWIDGGWVEVASPKPEPLVEAGPQAVSSTVQPTAGSAAVLQRPDPPPDPLEAAAAPNAVRERRLPIYDWIGLETDEHPATVHKPTGHHSDDAAELAAKLRDFGQRDDHKLVRSKIARLREQRDAGELSYTDFATRVAELLTKTVTPHIAPDGNPSSS
jgi:hypothetical protein